MGVMSCAGVQTVVYVGLVESLLTGWREFGKVIGVFADNLSSIC